MTLLAAYEPPVKVVKSKVAEPNPFDAVVGQLAATFDPMLGGKGRTRSAITLEFPEGDRLRTLAKFSRAANALGYSYAKGEDTMTAQGRTAITLYLVPKITRERKTATPA
jgi:hypothetical protein